MSYIPFGNANAVSISKNIITIDTFKGVDLTNAPSNVSINRSPEAPNMIRDVPGKVRKRMGYHKTEQYTGAINGLYRLNDLKLVHAGTKLYLDGRKIYSGMKDNRGQSWQINGETYIVDGKKMLVFTSKSSKNPDEMKFNITAYFNSIRVNAGKDKGDVLATSTVPNDSPSYHAFPYGNGGYSDANNTTFYIGNTIVTPDVFAQTAKKGDKIGINTSYNNIIAVGLLTDTKEAMSEGDDEYSIKAVQDIAYIPIVAINKEPSGISSTNISSMVSPFNLMARGWKEQFIGDGRSKDYQLLLDELDSDEVVVREMGADGNWGTLKENIDFTVDRLNGTVIFKTAPPATPAQGVSNVEIQAYKTRGNGPDIINKCDVSIIYGSSGIMNRLFVTGNDDYPNRDYYSDVEEHTYFGDTWYCEVGQDDSKIVGYSIINNYLVAHKNDGENGQNIIMRYSGPDDIDNKGFQYFRIVNSLQGAGAVGKKNFVYLNEPLFATKRGIFAVTAADITGEKYSQNRSFYINKALESEDLENSYAIAYKDFYVIACTNRIYLLDTLQREYTKNAPYSTFQYECYYWNISKVNIMWVDGNTLCFGTKDGGLYRFYDDTESAGSYNDNGTSIPARWDIPDIDGKTFFKNKTFRYLSVRLAPAMISGFDAYALSRGLWSKLFSTGARSNYFNFSYIEFSKINFSSDTTPRTLGSKIKVKKVDRARFSIRNEKLNEPLGIYDIAFEYTQSGNFKG